MKFSLVERSSVRESTDIPSAPTGWHTVNRRHTPQKCIVYITRLLNAVRPNPYHLGRPTPDYDSNFQKHNVPLTLFTVIDANEPTLDKVRVRETHIGKGVFAERNYPAKSIIGQITGDLIEDPNYGSPYAIEVDATSQIEPHPPFRFLNHNCDPNCEFDFLPEPGQEEEGSTQTILYLIALRNIFAGEQLTIEYNWPATSAIPCECGASNCRGWVVCPWELDQVGSEQVFDAELQKEVKNSVTAPLDFEAEPELSLAVLDSHAQQLENSLNGLLVDGDEQTANREN